MEKERSEAVDQELGAILWSTARQSTRPLSREDQHMGHIGSTYGDGERLLLLLLLLLLFS